MIAPWYGRSAGYFTLVSFIVGEIEMHRLSFLEVFAPITRVPKDRTPPSVTIPSNQIPKYLVKTGGPEPRGDTRCDSGALAGTRWDRGHAVKRSICGSASFCYGVTAMTVRPKTPATRTA